jgi:hypothetical protein
VAALVVNGPSIGADIKQKHVAFLASRTRLNQEVTRNKLRNALGGLGNTFPEPAPVSNDTFSTSALVSGRRDLEHDDNSNDQKEPRHGHSLGLRIRSV